MMEISIGEAVLCTFIGAGIGLVIIALFHVWLHRRYP